MQDLGCVYSASGWLVQIRLSLEKCSLDDQTVCLLWSAADVISNPISFYHFLETKNPAAQPTFLSLFVLQSGLNK